MQHRRRGRTFGRVRSQRKSLLRNLAHHFIMRERIETTEAKAKELAPQIERLVTKAKTGSLAERRLLASRIPDVAAEKLIRVIAPRYRDRHGGYTRIVKLPSRRSDSARRALLEFVTD